MEQEKKRLRNYAFVEGYLRECYLRIGTTTTGKTYISGDVVVSINRYNSQRVHVFAFSTKTNGEENKAYNSLASLLGDKVVTIASYVKTLPQDNVELDLLDESVWEAATKVATRVWFSGSLEEYATISTDNNGNERETSTFSFRAANGSIRRDNEKKPFSPRCNVELDGSILSIRKETKKVGDGPDAEVEETGRLVLEYLYIDYKGIGHKFKVFAGTDHIGGNNTDTFAEYVDANYSVGQTAKFNISIVNLAEQKTVAPKQTSWGITSEPTVVTRFVHELRIIGGRSMSGIGDGDDVIYIGKDEVTDACTKRRVTAKENYEQSQARKVKTGTVKQEATPVKGFGQAVATGIQASNMPDNFVLPDFNEF